MKPVSEMSNSEIDTELAELMGWQYVQVKRTTINHLGDVIDWYYESRYEDNGKPMFWDSEWHPTSSLDQCHIIEDYLYGHNHDDRYSVYCVEHFTGMDVDDDWDLLHLSARQKSEALLMTLREEE